MVADGDHERQGTGKIRDLRKIFILKAADILTAPNDISCMHNQVDRIEPCSSVF